MLFWLLVGVVSTLCVVALWLAVLHFQPRPDLLVRCSGVPGTVIPKGFLVRQANNGDTYVSSCRTKIGPAGWVEVPAIREQR